MSRVARVAAVVLLVVGLVVAFVDVSVRPGHPDDTEHVGVAAADRTSQPVVRDAVVDAAEAPLAPARPAEPAEPARERVYAEAPLMVRMPGGRRVPVAAVSVRADRSLAVPDDIRTAGWWRGGSRLGDPFGSILVAAHVDSRTQGLGPFVELLTVRPGSRVLLSSHGLEQWFVVRSRRLVAQGPLARFPRLLSARGPVRLTLATCAPPFEPANGGYQRLAVVTAEPVGPPREVLTRG